ncbi:MAG: hypothetical protein WA375_11160, partial [Pseudolabrys sp.]
PTIVAAYEVTQIPMNNPRVKPAKNLVIDSLQTTKQLSVTGFQNERIISAVILRLIQIEAEQFVPIILRFSKSQPVIHVAGNLLWALGCKLIEPIDRLCIAATLLNDTIQPVATITPALVAGHAQQNELADEVAKDGSTVTGHCSSTRLCKTIKTCRFLPN